MTLMRPRLLCEAAYRLRLLQMQSSKKPPKPRALAVVAAEEQDMNRTRMTKTGYYSPKAHVELLAEYMRARQPAKENDRCT